MQRCYVNSGGACQNVRAGVTFHRRPLAETVPIMDTRRLGNYELLEEVGQGPIGTVFKAKDVRSGRTVALKVLSPFVTQQGYEYVNRLVEGAKAIAALKHPNIVLEFHIGSAEGRSFIAREYVQGKSLAEAILQQGGVGLEKAVRVGVSVARALEAAHGAGIAHRRLKPSNVLLGEDGSIKVSDFCIARIDRRSSRITESGRLSEGTYYLSPEGVPPEDHAASADVYSLGAVLYHTVTGHVPFGGETPDAVAYKKRRSELMPPKSYASFIPRTLEEAICKAMARSPRDRFSSAGAMAGVLGRAVKECAASKSDREPQGLNAALEIMRGKHQGSRILIDRKRKYVLEVREQGGRRRYCTLINDGSRLYLSAVPGVRVLVNGKKAKGEEIRSDDLITLQKIQLKCLIEPRNEDAGDLAALAMRKGLLTAQDQDVVLDEVVRREAGGGHVTAGEVMLEKKLVTAEQLSRLRSEFDGLLQAETSAGVKGVPTMALLGGKVGQIALQSDGRVVMELGGLTIGEEAIAAAQVAKRRSGAAIEPGLLDDVVFCDRCEEVVASEDIIKGIATQTGGRTYCRRCSEADPIVGSVIMTNKFRSSFRIEGLLGKGTLGKVYRATQLSNGEVMALKVITDRAVRNREVVDRLETFVFSALKLKHPNLVGVMPIELTQKEAFLPMEFAGEKTAADLSQREPLSLTREKDRLRLQRLVDIVFQVLSALEAVHKERVVHGEIRPEKIFIAEDGVVRLADAGLPSGIIMGAQADESVLASHRRRFSAPEILAKQRFDDPRSDIYSMGLILCLFLTGSEFFRVYMPKGGMPTELQETLLAGDKLPEGVPVRLIRLIYRMINAAPESRYPRAAHALRELLRVQKDLAT